MATGRIGTTPVLRTRWSKEPAGGTTSLSGLDDYSVSLVYEVGYEAVYQNGALLSRGNDYTATDGTTITLTNATVAGDIIEVFANNVVPLTDTYSQSVADGKFVNNTIVDAKGDLIVGSAADTFTRLAVGSANQVLTVDSATTSGLKWATPSAGGMTLLATTTFNNTVSTYTFSSLGSYKHLLFIGSDMQQNSAAANSQLNMRFNSDSGSNYGYSLMQMNGTTYSGTAGANQESQIIISVPAGSVVGSQGNAQPRLRGGELYLMICNYGSTNQVKPVFWSGGSAQDGTRCETQAVGRWYNTSAITSVTIYFANTGVNFHTGTLLLYGVD